ncbi:hypothetical protein B9Z55_024414 [Caenorhabditis nigoni]|nr:hypothetical protein B9Z55_024414 [Caenorhabditis nigoni]
MASDSPIYLKPLASQFSKQHPQWNDKDTLKEMMKLLKMLDSWNLQIEEKIRIAFAFRTKVSGEMEREIRELTNSITEVDEKNVIVSYASHVLGLRTKSTRGQKRRVLEEHGGQGTGATPQDVDKAVENHEEENVAPPQKRLVGLHALNDGLQMIARTQQAKQATRADPGPYIAAFHQYFGQLRRDEKSSNAANEPNEHIADEEILPNRQPIAEAPQEPRIKSEPLDNDIYIIETPTVPTVAKLAQGVARLADVFVLKEVKNSAKRIAELGTRYHKTLKVNELDVLVRGMVDSIESRATDNGDNAECLRDFLRDFKNHFLMEVGIEFLKEDILKKIEARIDELERAQVFISKVDIKCLIADVLLNQCELRTKL